MLAFKKSFQVYYAKKATHIPMRITFKRILLHRTILSKKGYKAAEAFTNVIAYFLVKKIASWIFFAEMGLSLGFW